MTDGHKEVSSFCSASNNDCWKLFSIATVTSVVEYYIGWKYAGSSIAQADSVHAFIHSLWYGSPLLGCWWITLRKLSLPEGERLRMRLNTWNMYFLFASLIWVGGEALVRFWHSIPIANAWYMLASGLCGITGNTLCLKILNRIKRHGPENDTAAPHSMHKYFLGIRLDALADLAVSIVVTILAAGLLTASVFKAVRPAVAHIHYWEPLATIGILIWIGRQGYQLFRK